LFPSLTISLIVLLVYQLQGGRKQGDTCIVPDGSDSPSIVVEAGHSESLRQLRIDAKRWLEDSRIDVSDIYSSKHFFLSHGNISQVWMVIIISIDPPLANSNPATPQITVEHWKLRAIQQPLHSNSTAHTMEAYQAWTSDWTTAVPANYYILLADLFGSSPIPAVYAGHTHLTFNNQCMVLWRQRIIDSYQ
jgi:hypothetical protein